MAGYICNIEVPTVHAHEPNMKVSPYTLLFPKHLNQKHMSHTHTGNPLDTILQNALSLATSLQHKIPYEHKETHNLPCNTQRDTCDPQNMSLHGDEFPVQTQADIKHGLQMSRNKYDLHPSPLLTQKVHVVGNW